MSTTNITSRSESEYTRAKKNRRARKRILGEFIRVLVMIALVLITLIPCYISVIYSIKYKNEITINHLAWPKNPTFNNYLRVITENQQFLIGLKNSIFTTIPTVLILLVCCSMAAWILARNENRRFYNFMYTVMTLGTLIPFQCIMLPLYLNFYNAGLISTDIGFVIARSGLQVSISLLVITSFVKTVPRELEEAAQIDGCNMWDTFWKIVFPLLRPINATQLVLNTVYVWNDYNTAVVLLRDKASRTLPLAQIVYFNENTAELNLAFAFFIMSMIPILILYFSLQKYIVSGIMSGAVKG